MSNAFNWRGAPSKNGPSLQNFGRFAKAATELPVPERKALALHNKPRYQQGPALV